MLAAVIPWYVRYQQLKHQALCLDIETMGFNGPISVIGIYRPASGFPDAVQWVHGEHHPEALLKDHFQRCKLLITFNGLSFDVPRLRAQFPSLIPEGLPIVDLYRIARHLGLPASLKTLEQMFGIERLDERTQRRGIAVRLWQNHQIFGDQGSLHRLLEYNRQDVINLYPLAECLMRIADGSYCRPYR